MCIDLNQVFKYHVTLDHNLNPKGPQGIKSVEEALAIIEQFNKIKQRYEPIIFICLFLEDN